jgi:hypothetical protein
MRAAVTASKPALTRAPTIPLIVSPVPPMASRAGRLGSASRSTIRPSCAMWSVAPFTTSVRAALPLAYAAATSSGMRELSDSKRWRLT